MNTKIPISNIVRIDHINNIKKATLIYKDNENQIQEINLKSAECGWLKKHPNDSIINRLYYLSMGVHYVADRYRSPENSKHRTLTFFVSEEKAITFYSDDTNEIKFAQTLNLLHSHKWGTFDTN